MIKNNGRVTIGEYVNFSDKSPRFRGYRQLMVSRFPRTVARTSNIRPRFVSS